MTLLCVAVPGYPQRVVVGLEGGLRLTGDEPWFAWGVSNSRRYVVGPKVEAGLPLHFAVEVDALYSRLGNTVYYPFIANEYTIRTIGNSWAFPALLKYRLPVRGVRPFLSAGIAPRWASGATHLIHYGYLPSDISFSSGTWSAHDYAWVLGGGVEFRIWKLRAAPEMRYLRWRVPPVPSHNDVANYLEVAPNEAQLLLGISWPSK